MGYWAQEVLLEGAGFFGSLVGSHKGKEGASDWVGIRCARARAGGEEGGGGDPSPNGGLANVMNEGCSVLGCVILYV